VKRGKKSIFHAIRCPSIPSPSLSTISTIFSFRLQREKKCRKNCISRKWRRREETLLLFFFMRPMTLMLDATLFFHHPETSPAPKEMLSNVAIFFLLLRWWLLKWNTRRRRSLHFSFALPVSQKTKNPMMHHDGSAF
jgi:hypothetical protein